MSKRIIILIIGLIALISISSFAVYQYVQEQNKKAEMVYTVVNNESREISQPYYKSWEQTVTLGAIGDILIHDWVYEDAQKGNDYDFKPMFQYIKPTLLKPDVLVANQETVLGGTEIGLSSYPTFNSPYEVGDALIDSGVDIVTTANNHTLDRGEKAIMNAIAYYERVGLPYVGHFKDFEDQQKLRILNVKGIKFAFLAYTYGTNGIPVPPGKEYLVNLIDTDVMKEEIERAKKEADVIVMNIHWGNEYQRYPSTQQKELAKELAEYGVDIIIGHHPHVLQPMEWIENGDRKTFVIYSLGNFLSGQMWDYKDIGGMIQLEVTKKVENNKTTIEIFNPEFYPTYVSNKKLSTYRIVPLQNAGDFGLKNAKATYEEIMKHMFQWIEE